MVRRFIGWIVGVERRWLVVFAIEKVKLTNAKCNVCGAKRKLRFKSFSCPNNQAPSSRFFVGQTVSLHQTPNSEFDRSQLAFRPD